MNKRSALIPLCALAGLTLLFWCKLVFTRQTLFFDLTYRYFYPIAAFLSDAVHAHRLPLWNPYLYGGMPFLANPQTGVFYPFTYLFTVFPFPYALTLFICLHTFLAGLFMYALARRFNATARGALAAAFIFMFNGYVVLHAEFISNIASYVWLPLIVLFFHDALRTADAKPHVLAALCLTLQFFGGMPAYTYYTLILLLVILLVDGRTRAGCASFTVVVGLFTLMALPQLLPSLELARQSVRGTGLDLAAATAYSIRPGDFWKFLVTPRWNSLPPFHLGDTHVVGFYVGLPGLYLILSGIARATTRRDVVLAILMVVSALLAMGAYLPLYGFFYTYIPGWHQFRFPAQTMYIALFCAAVLAARGIERFSAPLGPRVLLLLLFVDLFLFGLKAHPLTDISFYRQQAPNIAFLQSDPGLFRIMLTPMTRKADPLPARNARQAGINYQDMLYPNTPGAYKVFDADGYDTLRLAAYDTLLNGITSPSSPLLDALNVKYLLSYKPLNDPRYALAKEGYPAIYRNARCLPRFYFADAAVILPENRVMAYLSAPSFDPRREVVLIAAERPAPAAPRAGNAAPSDPDVIAYAPGEITLATSLDAPRYLVAAEAWYPKWRAEVDGAPTPLLRANYALRAVLVPAGRHVVRFVYRPGPVSVTALGISLVVFLSSLLFLFRRGRRRREDGAR